MRASIAAQAHVAGCLLGAADLSALQPIHDARLRGARAEQLAQRIVGVDVLSVVFDLVASQQRVAERVDDRALRVHTARADDTSERRQRLT